TCSRAVVVKRTLRRVTIPAVPEEPLQRPQAGRPRHLPAKPPKLVEEPRGQQGPASRPDRDAGDPLQFLQEVPSAWSSSSSTSAKSASPCSAKARSSSAPLLASRPRSHRSWSG